MFEPCRTWAGFCVSAMLDMSDNSGNGGERARPAAPACARACRPRRALSARTTIRRASSILKSLSPDGFASASAVSAARRKLEASARAPASVCSASRARHGFAATPPSASRASMMVSSSRRKAGRGRHDREGIRGALADFQIAGVRGELRRLGRQTHRDDHLARLEHALAVRRVAGQAVKGFERNLARGPRGPRFRRRRRARPAARRNPTGASRCSARSIPARRAGVLSPPRASQPAPGSVCCRRSRRRRNRRSACAAADCRRPVAALRSCAEAPESSASATAGKRRAKSRRHARGRRCAPARRSGRRRRRERLDPVEPGKAGDVDEPRSGGRRRPSSGREGWCRRRDRRRPAAAAAATASASVAGLT